MCSGASAGAGSAGGRPRARGECRAADATRRGRHCKRSRGLEPAAEALEPEDLPSLLAGHSAELLVGVHGDGVTDGTQHRQVRFRVGVRIGGGEINALADGELADGNRLSLAVGEHAAGAARVDAVMDLGDARADRAVEGEHVGKHLGQLLRSCGDDVGPSPRVLMLVGDGQHLRVQARQDPRQDVRAEPLDVADPRPLQARRDAVAQRRGALVRRAVEPEADIGPGVGRELAASEEAGSVGRARELEGRRALHQGSIEVEKGGFAA